MTVLLCTFFNDVVINLDFDLGMRRTRSYYRAAREMQARLDDPERLPLPNAAARIYEVSDSRHTCFISSLLSITLLHNCHLVVDFL